jgi:hypothetical protein
MWLKSYGRYVCSPRSAPVPSTLDKFVLSVFGADGKRLPPSMAMHVDDLLSSEVKELFQWIVSASVLSLYIVVCTDTFKIEL